MSEVNNVISNFKQYSSWLSTIEYMGETLWFKPIAQDRWSISEIIAHITNWDKHLLSEVLPSVREEKGMEFPDFDTYNKKASEHAKSGISQSKLFEEAKDTRELLVKELYEMPIEKLNKPLTANGVTHCPHTGTPYSLLHIIKEFIDHDNYHKRQIVQFLKENI
ncbi:DinB family protein [Neobacillus niacini]|uniref:DinB family protein n=1 Tax=Neobacillus niacini TaxID=86668 RepID=UPI0005EE550B|nr:DinB family protein [Neobacillus niacini]